MKRWVSRSFVVVGSFVGAVVVPVVGGASCGGDSVVFYEVTRTRSEECTIRSNGEFCVEPDQFDPPRVEVWTIEVQEHVSRVFVDEEVWILDPLPDDADDETTRLATRTSSRSRVVTDGAGPCTATTTEDLSFTADRADFNGELAIRSVIEGPEACGTTPVGERTLDDLKGRAFTDPDNTLPVGP